MSGDLHTQSFQAFEATLTRALGAVVGGAALSRALGYPSQGAFRQAVARNRLPVRVFSLDGRRGRFAMTSDIARWLWVQRARATEGCALAIGGTGRQDTIANRSELSPDAHADVIEEGAAMS